MRVRLKSVLLTLALLALGAGVMGLVVLYSGFYNIAATHQHLKPTYWLLQVGLREAIERRAREIEPPPLDDPALFRRGAALYAKHCTQCHGAPGVAPAPFALGLTPLPKNLAHVARERSAAELYWVIRSGIKMTGMPAWAFRFSEDELWAVVAFTQRLPLLSPRDYAAHVAAEPESTAEGGPAAGPTPRGDARRGKIALQQYACTTCHKIPDVTGAYAQVGPPLDRMATRRYIAGVIPNTPHNMVRWLRDPKTVAPLTAMPDLGVTEAAAWDMTAYLYTLQ